MIQFDYSNILQLGWNHLLVSLMESADDEIGEILECFFLRKMKMSPKKGPFQKDNIVFQPLFFRG